MGEPRGATWDARASRLYHWESPQHLANDFSMGRKFIEPGIPAAETSLAVALKGDFGTIPKVPMNGSFLTEEELKLKEVVEWIDAGMPE